MLFGEFIKNAITKLVEAGDGDAVTDAYLLFEHVTGITRSEYILKEQSELSSDDEVKLNELLIRRINREPLAYITNKAYFMGLEFYVESGVLIPGFDTEVLVERALELCKDGDKIIDVCVGSGCIACSIAHYANESGKRISMTGLDISEIAVKVSSRNAKSIKLNDDSSIDIMESDLFSSIISDESYLNNVDMIVSNPPYIRTEVIDELMPEVSVYEPRLALDGDTDGLIFYRRISKDALAFLKSGGYLIYEIGFDQADAVCDILAELGYMDIRVHKDLANDDRVVEARRA